MKRLAQIPIRHFSVLLIMAVCLGSLLLSSLVHVWSEARSARSALGDELTTLATVLANRSTAALAFDDAKTAAENLSALKDVRHVLRACLYGEQGELFASYVRALPPRSPGAAAALPEAVSRACQMQMPTGEQTLLFSADGAQLRQPVHVDDQKRAWLLIDSSLDGVHERLLQQLQLQGGVLLVATLLALAAALRLQRLISQPIQQLSQVAQSIVSTHDYATRAQRGGPLELDALSASFNQLMQTTQQQHAELESARVIAQGRFEQLRDSEAYNKLLFRESCMAQGILDPQTLRFVDCNRAALELFGFGLPRQLLGMAPADVAPIRQPDGSASGELLATHLAAALSGERCVFEMQLLRERPDLGPLPWEAELHLDRFESGLKTLLQISLIDVSARVQAQRELEELNQQLESRVVRRTEALSAANSQLSSALDALQNTKDELVRSERLASLGAMVAGVAHELNTPIGNSLVVASTLQEHSLVLQRDMESGQMRRSTLNTYLDLAQESSGLLMRNLQRAAELVSRFKQVAGDQSGGQRQRFDLAELLQQLTAALQPQFLATPHQLSCQVPEGLRMDSRPGALEQVLTQLVMNTLVHAHSASRAGHTRIEAHLKDGESGLLQLSVSDDGCGISPEALPRIFDPFFTTRMGSGGNGLGLHTVFSLVNKSLGGRISVESQPGLGSKFLLEIPCIAPRGLDEKL
ncbi:ATP-binding protein [Paucibacter sp. Y2R2-4]|uniref:ATP-binding protein n=1 Tax=Paucibacter sp. Y2R2-4 TaxID=2893553 RepID=UPI0021E4EBDB|nr:ATP-binding protein [Paucibacter sp. Y2R2-4]MCV2351902.1 HAMP domain-containing protein [Paucibacter sp. Y2R2-4]